MMKHILILILTFLLICSGYSQQDEQKQLPKLDIPEITIVGKKAITLPFAKKGEYTVIDYIKAPRKDSTIVGNKQIFVSPISTKRVTGDFKERFNGYFEAGMGNYSIFHSLGLIRYSDERLEGTIKAGYNSTSGHTKNADGNRFSIGADFGTMINTDNEYLRSFRIINVVDFISEKFGIYGYRDSTIRRSRQLFSFKSSLASSEFKSISMNFQLGLNTFNIKDNNLNEISVFSPDFRVNTSFNVFGLNLLNKLNYETSVFNNSTQKESPALLQLSFLSRTFLRGDIYLTFGFKFINGTNSDGGYQRIFYPVGIIKADISSNLRFSLWFEPTVINNTYISHMLENPFLHKDLNLRYSFIPINIGVGVDYFYEYLSFGTKLSYSKVDDAFYPDVQDNLIYLKYADVDEIKLEINSIFEINRKLKLYTNAIYDRSNMAKLKKQLYMKPELIVQNRLEYVPEIPVNFYINVDYLTKRYLSTENNLPDNLLIGIGASSNFIKKMLISLDVYNLLNTKYYYYSGYKAPGVTLRTKFQYNF